MAAFAPIPHEKAFLKVAAQISDAIERGEYAVGEMLPAERKLCRQMDVSRPVMREAMSALQLIGIVRTRAGVGSFIANAAPHASASKIWTLAAEQSPTEVMETRRILEPAAARLAAARLTPAGADVMRAVLEEMRGIADEVTDAGQFGVLDFQFHQAVADASGNDVISKFIRAVVGYSNQRLWRSMRERSYQYSNGLALRYLEHHETTYRHLVGGETEDAAQSMLWHLKASQGALEGDWGEDETNGDEATVARREPSRKLE
ncbi:MAG: FadR/GntR family transcriptional regulator [Candidatus Dormibacteraceae bacterium]